MARRALVAFATPAWQAAFDLWCDPQKLHAAMLGRRPALDDATWRRIGPGRKVALAPATGGKTVDAMRVSCPRHETPPA